MSLFAISTPSHFKFLRRLTGFAGLPLLGALTPFLLMPVLARIVSRGTWSSIAIGQSVGGFAAIIVSLGWTLRGPSMVARSSRHERQGLYVGSLITRLFLFAVSIPVVVGIVAVLTPTQGRVIGTAMAVVASLGGLSAAWYNIGEGRALDIAIYDALPRMIATALSAVALIIFHDPIVYPLLTGAFTIAGIVAFTRRVCGNEFISHLHDFSLAKALRQGEVMKM